MAATRAEIRRLRELFEREGAQVLQEKLKPTDSQTLDSPLHKAFFALLGKMGLGEIQNES